MHTFTDNAGRVWVVSINVAAVKRVRAFLGVDLFKLIDDGFKPLGALVSDPVQLADVLYCLCRDEAEARKVSDEDFGRALAGDVISRAADAFLEELIDFFPEPKVRSSLRKILDEARKVRERILSRAEKVLETFDADREASRLLNSYGVAPESSASTPDPSPSGNSS